MSQLLEREQIKPKTKNQELITQAEYQKLVDNIKRIERRMRVQEAVRWLPFAILAGGIVGLIAAIASRLTPIFTTTQVLTLTLAAILICVAIMLGYAWLRPRRLLDTARRADRLLGLKSRTSTAIEGYNHPSEIGYSEFGRLQFKDAQNTLTNLKFSKAIPLKLSRNPSLADLGLIPLLLLTLFLPNPFSDQVEQKQVVQQQIQQEAHQLEQTKNQLQNSANKDDPKLQELIKQLEQTKTEIEKNDTSKESALAALDKAQQDLQQLNDTNAAAEKAAMDALAHDFKNNDLTKGAGDALSQTGPDRFDKAADQLNQAANNAAALQNNPNQADQLSQSLANDSKLFSKSDPALAQKLQQASDATKSNVVNKNPAAASQALKDLAQQLRTSGQNQQVQDQVQQAQSQLQNSEQKISQAGQQNQNGQQGQQQQQNQNGQPQAGNSNQQSNNGQMSDQSGDQSGQQGQQNSDQSGDQSGQQSSDQSGQQQGDQNGQQGQNGQQQAQNGQQQSGQNGQQQGQNGQQQGQNGQQSGQGQSQGNQQSQGGTKAGDGHIENVYANSSLVNPQNGQQVNVPGKQGSGPTNNQQVNSNQVNGNSSVPLSDAVGAYKNAASEAIDKNYVPITLKDVVKQYFNDLENGTGGSSSNSNSNNSNSNGK